MTSRPEESQDAEQRMLGAVPGVPALGRGPVADDHYSRHEYHHPAAGWGAARSVGAVLERAGEPLEGFRAIFVMNQEDGGFDCPSCAWPDDPNGLHLDICENGVKHVTWELAPANADREFFGAHTVSELAGWSDHDLEAVGVIEAVGDAVTEFAFGTQAEYDVELVRSLGADAVLDYRHEDFTETRDQYDVVFDAVGKLSFAQCRKAVTDGGMYLSTDLGPWQQNPALALWTARFGRKRVGFPLPRYARSDVELIKQLVEAGEYRAVVDRCYPLEQVVAATRYVETETKTGSVALCVAEGADRTPDPGMRA